MKKNALKVISFRAFFCDLEVELHQYYKTSKSCNFDIKNSPHISTSKPLQLLTLTVFADVCIAPALRGGAIGFFDGSIPIVFSKLAFFWYDL